MISDFLRRLTIPGVRTIRVGSEYGGWLIPSGFLHEGSVCYCAGAGEDISFDVELAERFGAHVIILDPTPRSILHFDNLRSSVNSGVRFPVSNSATAFYAISPGNLSRIRFLPIGLWDKTTTVTFFRPQNEAHVSHSIVNLQATDSGFDASVRRLGEIMESLGHDHIDLLKLDIEGAEGVALGTVIEDHLDVRVICVEFDEAAQRRDEQARQRLADLIKRLKQSDYLLVDMDNAMNALFVRTDVVAKLKNRPGRS